MSVPGIVQSTLDGEEIAARVSLGGEDELFVTSSSTLVYRSEGILSDESVDEYPHDADRLTLSEGRRKTKFTLDYPLEGTEEFTVPSGKTDAVLHPVLAGVLNGNGITDPGETVAQTYRFSELTLIITSDRLVKHIGAAVWDDDYEEYHFDDVTNLAFEDGSVATQIVLTVDGRPQRIKAPNDEANDLRERLKRALFEYHDVGSLEELNERVGGDDEDADPGRERSAVDFGDGVDPLDADPPELDDQEAQGESAVGATEPGDGQSTDPLAEGTPTTGSDANATGADVRDRTDQRARQQPDQGTAAQSSERATDRTESKADRAEAAAREAERAIEASADESMDPDVDDDRSVSAAVDPDPDPDTDDSGIDTESTSLLGTDVDTEAAESAAHDHAELIERIESLEAAVERQSDLIEQQQQTIEQLIAELRAQR